MLRQLLLEESNTETSYDALCVEQDAQLAKLKRLLGLQKFQEERRAAGPSYDVDGPFASTSSPTSPCIKKARKMKPPSSSESEEQEVEDDLGAPGIFYTYICNIIML
jgi:hypothetical protein